MHAVNPMPVPLTVGDDGVMRVSGTRVTLDSVVASFDAGATPEEIVQPVPDDHCRRCVCRRELRAREPSIR
jgi:uncharacterized protein DUF433